MTPTEVFERIAKLRVRGVADEVIGRSLGFDENDMREIVADKDYLLVESQVKIQQLEEEAEADEGWNGLERAAIKGLSAIAKTARGQSDSEFMLRLGALANRAERRGDGLRIKRGAERAPISAANLKPVTISLTRNYVTVLQNNNAQQREIMGRVIEGGVQNPPERSVANSQSSSYSQSGNESGAPNVPPNDQPAPQPALGQMTQIVSQAGPGGTLQKDINRLPIEQVLDLFGVDAEMVSRDGQPQVSLTEQALGGSFSLDEYFNSED